MPGRNEEPRISGPGYLIHTGHMAAQRMQKLAVFAVPHFDGFVERGTGQKSAVWTEFHVIYQRLTHKHVLTNQPSVSYHSKTTYLARPHLRSEF